MSLFIDEWKHHFQSYSRNIRFFFLFNLLWNMGISMFGLVYNLYVRELGYEPTMVGSLVGMTAIASAIILIPAGIMNDRFGSKRVASFGLLFVVGALLARSLIEGEQSLMISAFGCGMAQAVVSSTVLPFMANHSTPRQRVHLFSFNMALVMFASVIGNLAGGMFSDIFHMAMGYTEVQSLRFTLLIGVGITALSYIPVLQYRPDNSEAEPSDLDQPKTKWSQMIRNNKPTLLVIALFAFLSLLSSTSGGMIVPYLNVYFEDRFEVSKTVIGLIVSLGQGATAIAYLLGPVITRKLGEVRAVVWLQLASIPFLLITAYSSNFYLAGAGYLFRQALMNAANPFYNTIKMKYVDRSMRGLASSSGEAMFNLGWFIASPISTGLVAHYGSYYGYAYAFTITAIGYTLISYLFYLFFAKDRFFKPKESEQS